MPRYDDDKSYSYDGWSSVLRQWDVAYSIPNIDRFSHKGEHDHL